MMQKSKNVCTTPAQLYCPTAENRRIYRTSRKSASDLTSDGSSRVQGKGRRQTIDHRPDEAKTFYVPRRSRNCLNEGRGILETCFDSSRRPARNLSVPPYNR